MFHCTKCDAQFPKWVGRCDVCDSWGTLREEAASSNKQKNKIKGAARKSTPLSLGESRELKRVGTKDSEIDRVLGGGIVPGSLILISGEPGIGKSTLVAAIASSLGSPAQKSLYISGEESNEQLAGRFTRLKKPLENIAYLEASEVENLVATIEKEKPSLAIIDSIQTVPSSELDSNMGSPNMIRYATGLFLECAKRTGVPILIVGQVTKDGAIAGPKTLEHLVDAVLTLEGDPVHAFRILRATKNRFGSTDEVGVFEMGEAGLIAVPNPSERFLAERAVVPGSVVTATVEGSRVFLVEVQALVETSSYGTPVRRASGFDQNRLQMLIAILSKRAGLKLGDKDVYINVIGGMSLDEPSADLAVCAAILSAVTGTVAGNATAYFGEVGLGGEVRSVPMAEKRASEAERLGLEALVIPKKNSLKQKKLDVRQISNVNDLK